MPTCRHCKLKMTTWTNFRKHILTSCPVLHDKTIAQADISPSTEQSSTLPSACKPAQPNVVPSPGPAWPSAAGSQYPNPVFQRLHVRDLLRWTDWKQLLGMPDLTATLSHHCVLCHQWTAKGGLKKHVKAMRIMTMLNFAACLWLKLVAAPAKPFLRGHQAHAQFFGRSFSCRNCCHKVIPCPPPLPRLPFVPTMALSLEQLLQAEIAGFYQHFTPAPSTAPSTAHMGEPAQAARKRETKQQSPRANGPGTTEKELGTEAKDFLAQPEKLAELGGELRQPEQGRERPEGGAGIHEAEHAASSPSGIAPRRRALSEPLREGVLDLHGCGGARHFELPLQSLPAMERKATEGRGELFAPFPRVSDDVEERKSAWPK